MLQSGKDLKDCSVTELKALCYDLLVQREQNELQIRQVSQLIQQKLQEPEVPKEKE